MRRCGLLSVGPESAIEAHGVLIVDEASDTVLGVPLAELGLGPDDFFVKGV